MDVSTDTPSPHILVVDDEPVIREACHRTLEKLGSRIDDAASAEEALSFLKSNTYDVVLTDLVMPGTLDGEGLLEEVKRRSPDTDVMIMTSFPTLNTAIPTLKHGAFDYLIKPFDQAVLRIAVNRCLEKRRLSEELGREKRLRQELEAAYAQLQEMERLKEAFIARVNHELRIPLTPLFMALEHLREKVSDSKSRALCALLEERARRLQEVIENVLLFNDLRDQSFECSRKELNARDLLMGVVKEYRALWEEKHLEVDMRWEPGTERQMLDAGLIETAYKNLLLNAIHFNKTNGKITIQARRTQDHTEISFADTGIGIPADKLSQIFDSFYQVADYLTREVGGIGLGLTLVRRIVELHGGSVRIESRLGEGSTFTLILP
jgi:two-component system, sensor histidine kinase